jgi:hypothetical protein
MVCWVSRVSRVSKLPPPIARTRLLD